MAVTLSPSSLRRNKAQSTSLSEAFVLDLAARLFPAGRRPQRNILYGIGDDTAVLAPPPPGHVLLFTTDALAAGTHFTETDPPRAVAWKALAVNVSDIAAMGGVPSFAVVSIGLPRNTPVAYARALLYGLRRAANALNVTIVGGDTIRTPAVTLDIAMIGYAKPAHLCTRAGARPGHLIAVTGPLGGSFLTGRHLRFSPRLPEAQWLVHHAKPSAMMDLSDGLALDASRMADASRVTFCLDSRAIPRYRKVSLHAALNDGEDFELLCTFPPRRLTQHILRAFHTRFHRPLAIIGRVIAGPSQVLLDNQPLTPHAFEHFS